MGVTYLLVGVAKCGNFKMAEGMDVDPAPAVVRDKKRFEVKKV